MPFFLSRTSGGADKDVVHSQWAAMIWTENRGFDRSDDLCMLCNEEMALQKLDWEQGCDEEAVSDFPLEPDKVGNFHTDL